MKPSGLFLQRSRGRILRLVDFVDSLRVRRALDRLGAGDAPSIPSHTNRRELAVLFDLATRCPAGGTALEIGSHLGASSCYIAAGLAPRGGRLYCVDPWTNLEMPGMVHDIFPGFMKNTAGLANCITTVRKRSEALLPGDVPSPLHLAFIDGEHAYAAVRLDFQFAAPLIAENGCIAFHDFQYFEGVARVVGEALASGKWVPEGYVDNLVWLRRRAFNRACDPEPGPISNSLAGAVATELSR